ncbi:hypothetical protein [Bradyrhizobium guangxiense]|uniref:hypothetical protein n=1 Tax=Bradyrhizobium guangxiense TaxID=1325115 RepID=UPI001008D378|nr:hypothetical protein [Bradyrhizobium guangxiense]
MSTFREKHIAAGERYRAAVLELRAAYGELGAFDRRASAPGFGVPPEIVPLRHSVFAPNVAGSFAEDVRGAFEARPWER